MTYKEAKKEIMFMEMNLDYANSDAEVLKMSLSRLKNYIMESHNGRNDRTGKRSDRAKG